MKNISILPHEFIGSSESFLVEEESGRVWSQEAFLLAVLGTAESIAERVPRSGRVLVEARNTAETIVIYFACQYSGVSFVALDATRDDLDGFGKLVKPHLVVSDTSVDELQPFRRIKARDLVREATSPKLLDQVSIDGLQIADIFTSSGTTGSRKAIEMPLSNRIYSTIEGAKVLGHTAADVHFCVLPLLHTASWAYHIWPAVLTGGRLVLADKFHRSSFWSSVIEHNATYVQLVPTIMAMLLNPPEPHYASDLEAVKFIGCGSSILHRDLKRRFEECYKVSIVNQYGLSEICSTHTTLPGMADSVADVSSVGHPIDGVEVRLAPRKGTESPVEGIGEILIKGPTVMKGYLSTDGSHADVFTDSGFFKTGDLGVYDSEGQLYIVDRVKDLIIKGGMNLLPSEIEGALLGIPGVRDASVFSLPDEIYGEEIYAAVVFEDEVFDLDLHHILKFKQPKKIFPVESLPVGFSGKKLRRMLREEYMKEEST